MKLLFDANVSHKLVRELASEYPDSTHVKDVNAPTAPTTTTGGAGTVVTSIPMAPCTIRARRLAGRA